MSTDCVGDPAHASAMRVLERIGNLQVDEAAISGSCLQFMKCDLRLVQSRFIPRI